MLARDEQVRPRPPVTLPGPPRADDADSAPTKVSGTWPAAAISPPPTPTPRMRDNGEIGRRADRFEKAKARASEPGDQRNGDWTREQLEQMNAQFCQRLTRAVSCCPAPRCVQQTGIAMRAHKDTIESDGAVDAIASALAPEQLIIIQTRARAVPPRWRDKFLRAVADRLALAPAPTNKNVLEACAAARRAICVGIGVPGVEEW